MPGWTHRRAAALAPLLVAAALAFAGVAPAAPLTAAENARLFRGEAIEHPDVVEQRGERYAGGSTYAIVETSADQLDLVLQDVFAYAHILPNTREVKLISRDGSRLLVWLRQGTSIFNASYTIRVSPGAGERPGERLVRFWIDRSKPHGIRDASGAFRYEPLAPGADGRPRVLLTFSIWFDLGPGIVRSLFEGRIQQIVLAVPERLRAYLATRPRA